MGGNRASPDNRSVHSQGSGSKAGSRSSGNSKASGASSGGLTQLARTVQQMAIPSPSYDHSVSISVQAHSREPVLHRDIFGNLDEFWIQRALPMPLAASSSASSHEEKKSVVPIPDQQKDEAFQMLAEDLMHALLNDIVGDSDVTAALSALPVQPTHKCACLLPSSPPPPPPLLPLLPLSSFPPCAMPSNTASICFALMVRPQIRAAHDAAPHTLPLDYPLCFSSCGLEAPERCGVTRSESRDRFLHRLS